MFLKTYTKDKVFCGGCRIGYPYRLAVILPQNAAGRKKIEYLVPLVTETGVTGLNLGRSVYFCIAATERVSTFV